MFVFERDKAITSLKANIKRGFNSERDYKYLLWLYSVLSWHEEQHDQYLESFNYLQTNYFFIYKKKLKKKKV